MKTGLVNRLFFHLLLISVSGALAIAGQWLGIAGLVFVFKPVTTLLVMALAMGGEPVQPAPYRKWILAGLTASLAGDVFLMLPGNFFIHGLVSFLIAHLFYLLALCGPGYGRATPETPAQHQKVGLRLMTWPYAMYALLSAVLLLVLYPRLPAALPGPVIAYVVFLASMAAQALARHRVLSQSFSLYAAWGGAFFVCSDAHLAFNKFHTPFAWSSFVVLATYWTAQSLLALSVRQDLRQDGRH